MSEPYRPSNGTEGECFMEAFCFRCARDAKFQESQDGADGCPIVAAALMYDIGDPQYPPEWIYDEQGSRCTAFTLDAPPDEQDRFYARRDPRQASLPL
jgi:hypothetical protein